jgi:hypothetical protein
MEVNIAYIKEYIIKIKLIFIIIVVGYVATNNVNVRIDDAYADPRFN